MVIDKLSGYEIIANGKDDQDRPELVYQVMLFNGSDDYYIIVGQAKENYEQNLKTFKSIAQTFKRK